MYPYIYISIYIYIHMYIIIYPKNIHAFIISHFAFMFSGGIVVDPKPTRFESEICRLQSTWWLIPVG